jgi:hypothetical protein
MPIPLAWGTWRVLRGLVATLQSTSLTELAAKQLEILMVAVPRVTRIVSPSSSRKGSNSTYGWRRAPVQTSARK